MLVAPFAGAWIEIFYIVKKGYFTLSLPSRERGLKSIDLDGQEATIQSLPSRERGLKFCFLRIESELGSKSLPSRERGLKFVAGILLFEFLLSLPSRERGLKYC